MPINFNTEPYNDDYSEDSKFHRILFRPGFPVQARELTQLQTILQKQIERHGNHIFKQGAMVIPGQTSFENGVDLIKLQPFYTGLNVNSYVQNFEGKTIVSDSGIKALVIKAVAQTASDPITLYVRYNNASDDTTAITYSNNQIIRTSDNAFVAQLQSSNAVGKGSLAFIERGVYYINGFFVLVDSESIIIDKYGTTPSARIGLRVLEEIVTPENDETILDNAAGSFNFAAPGGHRYKIDAYLDSIPAGSELDVNFVELMAVEDGFIKKQIRSTEYSVLEQTLARRTFDESGNYTVKNFEIDVREHRDNNRGAWASTTAYLLGDVVTHLGRTYVARNSGTSVSTPPTHLSGKAYDGPGSTGIYWEFTTEPEYNRGVFKPEDGGDESKLAIGLEPGKAYVQGYEIEKIATEFIEVNKSRESVQVDNANINLDIGNYILVTNVNGLPRVDDFSLVSLRDRVTDSAGRGTGVGTQVGTARVRFIEWENGTIGTASAVYKLGLFDVKMNSNKSFNRNVKSVYLNVSSDPQLSFTADIQPLKLRLIGAVTASASTTVTGTGTSFQTDLVAGDYVYVGTNLRRVVSVVSQNSITVDAAVTVTGETIDLAFTEVKETQNFSLIFPLPFYAIKSVRSALSTNDTTYTVMERFTGTTSTGGGGTCTLTVSTSSGEFASGAISTNYILVDNNATDGGSIVAPLSITPSGSSVTFTLPDTFASKSFVVIGTVNKTGAVLTEKTKTLQTNTVTFTTKAGATSSEIKLAKADGYRLVSVKMRSGTFTIPTGGYDIDITERYNFDDGQRDTHYDIARIVLKPSFPVPSAPIEVTFEYFNHNPGDYFTVNSYPADVDYKKIPAYGSLFLRDCIDFRPRIDDTGLNFTGAGSSTSRMPKRGFALRTDFTYYLARRTKIAIDFNGKFFAVDGVPALNPGEPQDPSLGMVLYTLVLEPFTFGTSNANVFINRIDNKRYTMRDIGKLEKRIDNIEYYTTLSLLEQETQALNITDEFGLDRFKNGFIVDNFSGHNTGDIISPDYRCSIDMENGELRPFFTMENVNLIEKNSTTAQRNASNYKMYGDVITLPVISQSKLVEQQYASRVENVNPFAVFTFLGNTTLTPPSDEWFEINRRPDIVNDVEGNFTTVKTMAEKSGVLGTVWNSWQTQWTGQTRTSTRLQRLATWSEQNTALVNSTTGFWRARSTFNAAELALIGATPGGRVLTWTTTARSVGQSREGIRTSVVAKIDRQVVEDRVLSSAVIPFIRSRNILVQARGLKPNTRFYPYFDDVGIEEYCTGSSTMVYTSSGEFDVNTNIGGLAAETARLINGDSQVCLNKGDIITGATSGATAIVVNTSINQTNNQKTLSIVNIKGTFQNGETITGSISNNTGSVVSVTTSTAGGPFVTNHNGDVDLIFNIPNNTSVRFRTGIREFKMVDYGPTTPWQVPSSSARASYFAQGALETRQATVNAVRNAEIVRERITESRVIIESAERLTRDTGWYDPLAQTFLVQQPGGAFLSKIDIFFASKDIAIPVTLEIREVVNGYPGRRVLPFSRVTLKPEQVNISTTTVNLNGINYPTYTTPTSFVFPSPVYVQDNNEYCFVLLSDSNEYRVWISQIGDLIPGSARTISEQPYAGVLFKSQNASTWTADQYQDMKFTIWRNVFSTSAVSNVQFVNDLMPLVTLENNPLETKTGQTKVRVHHENHGMTAGSIVTISGLPIGSYSGIPHTEINGNKTISDVDLDSYMITVTTSAVQDGFVGGNTIRATRNVQYDSIHPIIQMQTFSDTSVNFYVKTTSGKSVDSTTQIPYQIDPSFGPVVANETNTFNTPRMIASGVNESTSLSGQKSFTMTVEMATSNDSLTPVIDTRRVSLVAVNNKINHPTEDNLNVGGFDVNTIASSNTQISFSGNSITTTDAATMLLLLSMTVGRYVTISGSSQANNNGTFLVTRVVDNTTSVSVSFDKTFTTVAAGSSITLVEKTVFVDEIAPQGGSAYNKYLTRRIDLLNSSTFIRVRLACSVPDESDMEIYYKTSPVGNGTSIESLPFKRLLPNSGDIPKVQQGSNDFIDVDFSVTETEEFDAMLVKIVLKSTNSAAVPRAKDLRIIACA